MVAGCWWLVGGCRKDFRKRRGGHVVILKQLPGITAKRKAQQGSDNRKKGCVYRAYSITSAILLLYNYTYFSSKAIVVKMWATH